MKALIFAAGLGSRLRPLTDTTPKALIPIGGKPMLEHVILKLKASGFNELVINIHHHGQQIIDYLQSNNNFGLNIHISDERDQLLDTGGGIKHARQFLDGDEPFLVHNADILSNVDLKQLYEYHLRPHGNLGAAPRYLCGSVATLLVSQRETSRYLLFDKENRLHGWQNRETGEVKSPSPNFRPSMYNGYAFSGIHVISPEIFEWMDKWEGKFSIINFYLAICAKANIQAYPMDNLQLLDIGKPEALVKAEEWLKQNTP
ncbi:nucleotidyltransferase family protein [Bacteroides sp. 51]|uniref:nucleotidyltransferase family protein n=1 Tax=Bacteroides sp. 51 TaxID=2302938 RepID=UPI0013CF6B2C|nr:nucleotidyltransferase family protein [Bacteroides sp. 51]NDV82996.1 nucleotidyltransferase family protein [Bacteroides sp. 51]